MKLVKKLTLSAFLLAVCFAFTGIVSADDDYNITNPNIVINKPVVKKVYYKGENVNYNIKFTNPWGSYSFFPYVGMVKSGANDVAVSKYHELLGVGESKVYSGSLSTSKLSAGTYAFAAVGVAVDSSGNVPGTSEKAGKIIYVKTLKAPKKVKATAKKKGIRITYNKAAGATKYEIYRSRKKSSGYKKIITTTKVSYLDKKAKKNKKYYYKVRSVRTVNNTIKSGFSAKSNAKR